MNACPMIWAGAQHQDVAPEYMGPQRFNEIPERGAVAEREDCGIEGHVKLEPCPIA
jgi:hypothetical protein